jgi:hypothetical protein
MCDFAIAIGQQTGNSVTASFRPLRFRWLLEPVKRLLLFVEHFRPAFSAIIESIWGTGGAVLPCEGCEVSPWSEMHISPFFEASVHSALQTELTAFSEEA